MNVLDKAIAKANERGTDYIDDILAEHQIGIVDRSRYNNLTTLVIDFNDGHCTHVATVAYVGPKGKWYFIKETRYQKKEVEYAKG